jgi:hypothetical protein
MLYYSATSYYSNKVGVHCAIKFIVSSYSMLQDLIYIFTVFSESGVALYSRLFCNWTIAAQYIWSVCKGPGECIAYKTHVGIMTGLLSFLLPNLGKSCTVAKIILLTFCYPIFKIFAIL